MYIESQFVSIMKTIIFSTANTTVEKCGAFATEQHACP
jgi:hypothetical protein